MAGALFVPPYPQFRDDDGSPLAFGGVLFFITGSATPIDVYEDQELLTTLGANVSLDEGGRPVNGSNTPVSIWIDAAFAYKVRVQRVDATLVREVDPYRQGDPNRTGFERVNYTADGALSVVHGLHKISKTSAAAMTLTNPTSLEEGFVMHIRATTAFAHTVTLSGGFAGAGAGADVATFAGAVGDGFQIVAVNGLWHVVALTNVTLG